MRNQFWVTIVLVAGSLMTLTANASVFELFAKGAVSKNSISDDKYTLSVSASTGFAITVIPRVRIEGRYTNTSSLQNRMDVVTTNVLGTLTDIKTETLIYSIGIDLDLLGDKAGFQPFIYIGAGYVETSRSYYFTLADADSSTFFNEPKQTGVSGNLGAGFRIRIAQAFAFEVELFAYGVDIHKPNPLINLYGTVGIRLFI